MRKHRSGPFAIPVRDIVECVVTVHWQGCAITLGVRESFDCVLRSHGDAPKEHSMKHIAGALFELRGDELKLRLVQSQTGAKMKDVNQ